MTFQLVQTVYWLALSMWFGGAMFIGVAARVIQRTVAENDPTLPRVLSVNLEGKHSVLLAGAIVGNLSSLISRFEMVCAAALVLALGSQWFLVDLTDPWTKVSIFMRSGLFIAATGVMIYNGRFIWPKVLKTRQTVIDNADDPEKADPASEQLDALQSESERLLTILVFLLLGIIALSGGIKVPITFHSGG